MNSDDDDDYDDDGTLRSDFSPDTEFDGEEDDLDTSSSLRTADVYRCCEH